MATLYELKGALLELYQMADDIDVDEQALKDTIEAVEGELEIKADGYAKVIRQLKADAKALKDEEDRLKDRREAIERTIDKIQSRLKEVMKATGKIKFKTLDFSFLVKKNPPAVKIAEGITTDDVPAEYIKWGKPSIDNTKVKEALKNGEKFEWASLEQGESLQIK